MYVALRHELTSWLYVFGGYSEQYAPWKASHSCRITRERCESARERRKRCIKVKRSTSHRVFCYWVRFCCLVCGILEGLTPFFDSSKICLNRVCFFPCLDFVASCCGVWEFSTNYAEACFDVFRFMSGLCQSRNKYFSKEYQCYRIWSFAPAIFCVFWTWKTARSVSFVRHL